DLAVYAFIIAYKANRKLNNNITALIGVNKHTINIIYIRALKRGFNPNSRPIKIEDKHIKNKLHSSRPLK
ncbi:hypothetical protein COCMIDRAFT_110815, partial [Bipolaris oryzae ATCC 44560]